MQIAMGKADKESMHSKHLGAYNSLFLACLWPVLPYDYLISFSSSLRSPLYCLFKYKIVRYQYLKIKI